MLLHQFILYIIKLAILIIISLMSIKVIHVKTKTFIIIDFIFKLSLGSFLIYFFLFSNKIKLNVHDRLIFILSGFVLILLIDYIKVINIIFGQKIKDDLCDYES
jgi:hypothetical protein